MRELLESYLEFGSEHSPRLAAESFNLETDIPDWNEGSDGFVYGFIGQFVGHVIQASIDMRHFITVKIRE
jgi:hypothetical protein